MTPLPLPYSDHVTPFICIDAEALSASGALDKHTREVLPHWFLTFPLILGLDLDSCVFP